MLLCDDRQAFRGRGPLTLEFRVHKFYRGNVDKQYQFRKDRVCYDPQDIILKSLYHGEVEDREGRLRSRNPNFSSLNHGVPD